ncbi:MAG: hypothetical protein EAY65_01340 [Alphaproteobacteria bacterium]|nr:MAG: hypothetical protein EAY65_01340 [Alphaproteobacteria bacterium]
MPEVVVANPQPVIVAQQEDPFWYGVRQQLGNELVRYLIWLAQTGGQNQQPATPPPVQQLPASQPLQSYFPRATCGDKLPTRASAYLVTIYPVQIRYTSSNLNVVQDRFCHDAFVGSEGRRIFVASFTSRERAAIFARLMESQFGNAFIGEPEVIDERPF